MLDFHLFKLITPAQKLGASDAIMVNGWGQLTEGTTSNIFLVKNGFLKTPPISQYVLAGITRQVVLDIAKEHKIPFMEDPITENELINADEVFITNSGIEIVPVTQIDSQYIGNKKPGILTEFFHAEFLKCVEAEKDPC